MYREMNGSISLKSIVDEKVDIYSGNVNFYYLLRRWEMIIDCPLKTNSTKMKR